MIGYENTVIAHGELHEHAASGGTSDGKMTLAQWNAFREEKGLDFLAILDHRQIRHMYLPEYDTQHYLCGTEPGTMISDAAAREPHMHYNMLFPRKGDLADILEAFPEYAFTGGVEGHFIYPAFTKERFAALIAAVKAKGGLFVHPHPMQLMQADDVNEYAVTDGIGLEVLYETYDSAATRDNYALWRKLLTAGRRIWACAGTDSHGLTPGVKALTSVYTREKTCEGMMQPLSQGNFACGGVGIQMTLGGAVMGGSAVPEEGAVLYIRLADCYPADVGKRLQVRIFAGDDVIHTAAYTAGAILSFAVTARPCPFYRVELWEDETLYGLGNPIWIDADAAR